MNKNDLFSIGEVAKLFHISVSSLRHYESVGLLTPEYTDKSSGYRYYGARQFEVLDSIRYLRALDMPLSEIADFLNNRNIESIKEKLTSQKRAVIAKQEELKRIEHKLDNRLKMLEDAENSVFDKISLCKKESFRIVWISGELKINSFLDMEAPMRGLEKEQQEPLVFWGKVGLGISAEHLQQELFDSYDGIFLVLDGDDRFEGETTKLDESLCVTVRFHGTHAHAKKQYERLTEYIKEHELKITGFSREITMIDYAITDESDRFVTEIAVPVSKKGELP